MFEAVFFNSGKCKTVVKELGQNMH